MKINFKRYKYTPILGWSSSRYELFQKCQRHYFYNYYTKFVQGVPLEHLNRLKRLTSVPLEVGNVVHHIIEAFLRRLQQSDANIDEKRFIEYGMKLCDEFFDKKEFLEVYYGYTQEIDRDEAKAKIRVALTNFMNSPLFSWIFMKAITCRQNWVIEPDGFGETRINGLKAYCKMDFLFPVDDEIHILDWKSGKKHPEKHSKQLMGYALATQMNNPNVDGNRIIPRIIYMYPEMDELEFQITDASLAKFSTEVEEQTLEMHSFCKDIEQNIPREFSFFEKTSYTALCKHCPFQEPCKNATALPF